MIWFRLEHVVNRTTFSSSYWCFNLLNQSKMPPLGCCILAVPFAYFSGFLECVTILQIDQLKG